VASRPVHRGVVMAVFDDLVGDLSARFGLGTQAGALVTEMAQMIARQSGGLSGLIEKFNAVGLGTQVRTWLGKVDAPPVAAAQLEQVLGTSQIQAIASRLELGNSLVSHALAFAMPKLIGRLTPGGQIPVGVPDAITEFLGQYDRVEPLRVAIVNEPEPTQAAAGGVHWVLALLAILAMGGFLWYLLSGEPDKLAVAPVQAPLTASTQQADEPHLWFRNEAGMLSVYGTLAGEASRQSLLTALQTAFGADRIKANIGLDANAAPLMWLGQINPLIEGLKTPGVQVIIDNKAVGIGGIDDSARATIATAWKAVLGPSMQIGPIGEQAQVWVGNTLTSLKNRLQLLTDPASAPQVSSGLSEAAAQIGELGSLISHLSADQKRMATAAAAGALPALNGLFDKILAVPGLAATAKGGIDDLRKKLDALAKG
jgi:OOP family OmpA-OmpF porin